MAFFDNIKFPFFTLQELNLDWLLTEVKRIAGFMPQDGNVGDILTRKSDGAAWEPPAAVQVDIDGLPEDTQIMDNDQLIFYDISAQANRKIKPPNLLDSMCSNGTPYMNGTGSAGTSKKPSRYDHVHPTDTSRQAALSGTQMNAVNSGAPANSFSSGKLKIANGGTDADNVSDARANLGFDIVTELTLTYTNNSIVTNTEFAYTHAYFKNGIYLLCFNIFPVASQPATSDFVEIGTIADWDTTREAFMQIPCQVAPNVEPFPMIVKVTKTGSIQVYLSRGTPSSGARFYRANIVSF